MTSLSFVTGDSPSSVSLTDARFADSYSSTVINTCLALEPSHGPTIA